MTASNRQWGHSVRAETRRLYWEDHGQIFVSSVFSATSTTRWGHGIHLQGYWGLRPDYAPQHRECQLLRVCSETLRDVGRVFYYYKTDGVENGKREFIVDRNWEQGAVGSGSHLNNTPTYRHSYLCIQRKTSREGNPSLLVFIIISIIDIS